MSEKSEEPVLRYPVRCPTWGRIHFYVCLQQGRRYIEVRCRSERGAIEHVSYEQLQAIWLELERQEAGLPALPTD